MFLPEKIKQLREDKGYSQEDLMIALANEGHRVSRPTISNWETGDSTPDANDLYFLGQVFNKPVKAFFSFSTT